jgi:hypothetical protein
LAQTSFGACIKCDDAADTRPMRAILTLCVFAALAIGRLANAEMLPTLRSTEIIEGHGVAMTGATLTVNQRNITLFGIDAPTGNPQQSAAARQALDGILSRGPIRCNALRTWFRNVLATCATGDGADVATILLRSGAVTVFASQALASPQEKAYVAAEAVAREAQLGVWGPTDRPSSSGPEALDKVAVALATPPNPVPTGSILWYLHPWQSAIAGLFGLIGAALVLVAARHQANAQIRSVILQIEENRKRINDDKNKMKLGILFKYKHKCQDTMEKSGGFIRSFMGDDNENVSITISKWRMSSDLMIFENKDSFVINPEYFSIIGFEAGRAISKMMATISYYHHGLSIAFDKEKSDRFSGGREKIIIIVRDFMKGIYSTSSELEKIISDEIDKTIEEIPN